MPPPDDFKWFAENLQPHEQAVRAYLATRFPWLQEQDDVVQESYLRIWKARMARPIRFTKSYLFQIARNLSLDLTRHRYASPFVDVDNSVIVSVSDPAPAVEARVEARDELRLLAQAIDALPARCREILILRQLEGVPQKEIAAQLGISVLTVQVQIVRGLRRVNDYLRRHGVARDPR